MTLRNLTKEELLLRLIDLDEPQKAIDHLIKIFNKNNCNYFIWCDKYNGAIRGTSDKLIIETLAIIKVLCEQTGTKYEEFLRSIADAIQTNSPDSRNDEC